MEQRFIDLYMDYAKRAAEMSRAVRLHVGAVIVKDGNIISHSWNGTPAGWDNTCETVELMYDSDLALSEQEIKDKWPYEGQFWIKGEHQTRRYRLVTKPEVLHAERNALDKLARSTSSGEGATMFITHSPCLECAKSIYGAGIKQVYYETDYRSKDGVYFLQRCNVKVDKVSKDK